MCNFQQFRGKKWNKDSSLVSATGDSKGTKNIKIRSKLAEIKY